MKALENFKETNDRLRIVTDELKESNPKLETALKTVKSHAEAWTTCASQVKKAVDKLL